MSRDILCSCGAKVPDHEVFCPVCERRLSELAAPAPPPAVLAAGEQPPPAPGFVVFGLDQPATPTSPVAGFQAVLVKEEVTEPRRRAVDLSDADELANQLDLPRKRRRMLRSLNTWPLEKSWSDCLAYPFRAWPLILGLG